VQLKAVVLLVMWARSQLKAVVLLVVWARSQRALA
jgi:hypothetical protein